MEGKQAAEERTYFIEIKASGGWQRCADENVAQKCDAHLAVNNAEALLNKMHSLYFLNLTLQ